MPYCRCGGTGRHNRLKICRMNNPYRFDSGQRHHVGAINFAPAFFIYFLQEEEDSMEPKDYIVTKIDGEYAYLKEIKSDCEIFIAMALLPSGTDVGNRVHFEMFEYTLID